MEVRRTHLLKYKSYGYIVWNLTVEDNVSSCEPEKPKLSYVCIITLAIRNSTECCLQQLDIYQYILSKFPFFIKYGKNWRAAVRGTLSTQDCFIKLPKLWSGSGTGSGAFWTFHPLSTNMFNNVNDWERWKRQWKSQTKTHFGSGPNTDHANGRVKRKSILAVVLTLTKEKVWEWYGKVWAVSDPYVGMVWEGWMVIWNWYGP